MSMPRSMARATFQDATSCKATRKPLSMVVSLRQGRAEHGLEKDLGESQKAERAGHNGERPPQARRPKQAGQQHRRRGVIGQPPEQGGVNDQDRNRRQHTAGALDLNHPVGLDAEKSRREGLKNQKQGTARQQDRDSAREKRRSDPAG